VFFYVLFELKIPPHSRLGKILQSRPDPFKRSDSSRLIGVQTSGIGPMFTAAAESVFRTSNGKVFKFPSSKYVSDLSVIAALYCLAYPQTKLI